MSIIKTIFTVATITLLSRLLSLISLQTYMAYFGPFDVYINIYSFALTIPLVIFNIIGTIIVAVVVPIYSGLIAKDKNMASNFINNITTIVCVIVCILVFFSYFGVVLLADITGFHYQYRNFLIYALRVTIFSMFFYGLHYIFQGILHSHNKFILASFVTVPTSLIIICYVFIFGNTFGVRGLIYATVFGLSLQAIILLPAVIKQGFRYIPTINLKNEHVRKAMCLSAPVLLSVISFQINTFFNASLATRFNIVTIMAYVQNLAIVLVLSFVYSVTNVYLPKLTQIWESSGKVSNFKTTLEDVILICLFFLIPVAFGFLLLRFEIINLLAAWGNFNIYGVTIAANMLGIYGFGVLSIGIKEVIDRAFYAQKNSKVPGFVGFLIMVINVVFSLFTINVFEIYTMAISFALSNSVGVVFLLLFNKKSIGSFSSRLSKNAIKFIISAVIMSICVYFVRNFFSGIYLQTQFFTRVLQLFVPTIVGVIVYIICIIFLKVQGVDVVNLALKNKVRKYIKY